MGLPEPSEFSMDDLNERWAEKSGKCSRSLVLDFVNSGQLKMAEAYPARFASDPDTGEEVFLGSYVKHYFKLAEVQHFESELEKRGKEPPPTHHTRSEGEADTPAKESTRTIEGLQKALIAVAMDCYGYDPKSKLLPPT